LKKKEKRKKKLRYGFEWLFAMAFLRGDSEAQWKLGALYAEHTDGGPPQNW
jgi:TPR repeat protein